MDLLLIVGGWVDVCMHNLPRKSYGTCEALRLTCTICLKLGNTDWVVSGTVPGLSLSPA